MNFDEMLDNKELYQAIWRNLDLNKFHIIENGKSSYCFKNLYEGKKDSKELTLKKIFQIENPLLFHDKFTEAVSGSGSELKNILILRSSALCALLFFYNVTEENPLELPDFPNIKFTKSYFEYKTPVITAPSNMDVVLTGYDSLKNKNVVLFLESKFSEYLKTTCDIIGLPYLEKNRFYNSDFLKKLNLKFVEENNEIKKQFIVKKKIKEGFKLEYIDGKDQFYIDGIKQIISHFIGISNFVDGKTTEEEKRFISNDADVYLAEILFDKNKDELQSSTTKMSYFDMYEKKYRILTEALQENSQFKIKEKLLYYSSLLKSNHHFEKNIIEFYFGNE